MLFFAAGLASGFLAAGVRRRRDRLRDAVPFDDWAFGCSDSSVSLGSSSPSAAASSGSASALAAFVPPPRPPRPRPPRRRLRRFGAAVPSEVPPVPPASRPSPSPSAASGSAVVGSAVFVEPAAVDEAPDRLRDLFAPPRLRRRRGRGDGDAPSLDAVSPVGSDACGSSAAAIEEAWVSSVIDASPSSPGYAGARGRKRSPRVETRPMLLMDHAALGGRLDEPYRSGSRARRRARTTFPGAVRRRSGSHDPSSASAVGGPPATEAPTVRRAPAAEVPRASLPANARSNDPCGPYVCPQDSKGRGCFRSCR